MADYCTCGALLIEDARFCHRCGRPAREEPAVERAETPPPIPVAAAPPAIVPSFHQPMAVRIGLFAAAVAALLCLALPYGFVIWLPAAGFISVYIFSRRTGQTLSVRHGARMGWIAGILNFLIMTVLFTVTAVGLASRPGGLAGYFREQLNAGALPRAEVERAIEALANPAGQAMIYAFFLLFWFTVIAAFCTAGGALGAKVLAKD
jgi:hypothetical protein